MGKKAAERKIVAAKSEGIIGNTMAIEDIHQTCINLYDHRVSAFLFERNVLQLVDSFVFYFTREHVFEGREL